jgi:hypothetical protein
VMAMSAPAAPTCAKLTGLVSGKWRALLIIQEVLHAPHTLYERVSG